MNKWFTRFAGKASEVTGSSWAFLAAVAIILIWGLVGPLFGFADTWQLVINTGTTIITFLMVFLIQNTQNRDTKALQLKLDELIFVIAKANNALLDLEELDEVELDHIRERYERMAAQARQEGLRADTASAGTLAGAKGRAERVPRPAGNTDDP